MTQRLRQPDTQPEQVQVAADALTGPAPRTKPTDVRRHELMTAAMRVFVEKGVAGASIDEIVSLAGVAKGTFYLYFASKEELLTALRAHFSDRLQGRLNEFESLPARGDWPARLDAWVEGGVRAYIENIEAHDALFHCGDHHPHHRDAENNPVIEAFTRFIAAGDRAGAWHVGETDLISVLVYHALHGGLDFAVRVKTPFDERHFVRTMQQFTRRALGIGEVGSS